MAISSGRDVSVFTKAEAAYGTPEALTAADYLRVTTATLANDQLAAIPSPEKTPGRDRAEVFRGRPTSNVSLGTLLRGSPTGGARYATLIENAMGAARVAVANAAAVTGNANAGVALMVAGATDGMFRPQIGGSASPLIPLSGAAAYASVNFPLGSGRRSNTVRYQPLEADGAPAQLVAGWSINTMTVTIDGSGSPATVDFDGPAARTWHGPGLPAAGGAGANVALPADLAEDQPLSGLVARAWFRRRPDDGSDPTGAFTELTDVFRSLTLTLTNNVALRMDEAGSLYSRGILWSDHRTTTLALSAWAEVGNPLWTDIRDGLAAGTPRDYEIFVAVGNRAGARVGFFAPRWLPALPSGDDGAAGIGWTITGELLSGTYGAGDSSFALGIG